MFLLVCSSISIYKSWTKLNNRLPDDYWCDTEEFINLASHHLISNGLISCQCKNCLNRSWEKLSKISPDIIDHSFHPNYNAWFCYGEKKVYPELLSIQASGSGSDFQWEDEMTEVLVDLVNEINFTHDDDNIDDTEPTDKEASSFDMMFVELQSEFWPGYTKCHRLILLLSLCIYKSCTNGQIVRLTCWCDLLNISHPDYNKVLDSYYDARKKLHAIRLGYKSIHVCKYDCVLFWKDNATYEVCPVSKIVGGWKRQEKERMYPTKFCDIFL